MMNRAAPAILRNNAPGKSARVLWEPWLRAVAVLLIALAGCTPPIYNPPEHVVPQIAMDGAVTTFFQVVQQQFENECVVCLYGMVRNDTAFVAFMRPAAIQVATSDSVRYVPCPQPRAGIFGALRYLGTQHNHPGVGFCSFSGTDDYSFAHDSAAVLDVVTCDTGTLARLKPLATR